MPPPTFPVLQNLHRLDFSSPHFQDQLYDALSGQEYARCTSDLDEGDLVWLADYLDEATNHLEPLCDAFWKCLRELGSVCGSRGILPTSYVIPALEIDPEPFVSGGFGDVFKGTYNSSRVRIKRVWLYTDDPPEKALKTFCKEAVILKRLAHPNVIPFLGVTTSPWLLFTSNWISDVNLPEYTKNHPDADHVQLLSDVAQGLEYLHSCNVIHGDLIGLNILVDDSGCARIADPGLAMIAKDLSSSSYASHHHCPVPQWPAPEVLEEGNYGKEADIFSFAMVAVEVFAGEVSFSRVNSITALSIMQGERPPRPTHPYLTEDLWLLMQRCWDHDLHSRPKVAEMSRVLLTLDTPTWKQLTTQTLSEEERISLITTIFSDLNQIKTAENLSGDDVRNFIDKIEETLDSLTPMIYEKCQHYLLRICGRLGLLPRSLEIPLCYDQTEAPIFRGGLADVWKGQHQGRVAAAHVFRILPGEDTELIKRRFCGEVVTWRTQHPNVLPLMGVTITDNRLVMVSEWMVRGNIKEYIKVAPGVDRLQLLLGATRGLIYLHEHGIIHGDLNGANIFIDNDGHARLTGFGLATIASTLRYAPSVDGSIPWKSPELMFPVKFGLSECFPTKASDCYALGMVIYEVLSGQVPFGACWSFQVAFMVLEGRRPERPQGDDGKTFADGIWKVMELCWEQEPGDRPSAEGVLNALEGFSSQKRPLTACDSEGPSNSNEGWVNALVRGAGRLLWIL